MKYKEVLIGKRFGRLKVIDFAPDYVSPSGKHWSKYVCTCDCGKIKEIRAYSLKSRLTVSCGCHNRAVNAARLTTHGLHLHPLYSTWKGMRERCSNPKQRYWHRYGGRGIFVCKEWDNFQTFKEWAIQQGWCKGLQVDRIDEDDGYSPDNCRIVTCKENNDHRNSPRDEKGRYKAKENSDVSDN
jgi:hypothetical protein